MRVRLPIRLRLTLLYCAVLGLSFVGFFYICDVGFERSIETTVNDASRSDLEIVRRLLKGAAAQDRKGLEQELKSLAALWANGALLEVMDSSGSWIFRSRQFANSSIDLPSSRTTGIVFATTNLDLQQYRVATDNVISGGQTHQVRVAVPTEPFDQALDSFRLIEKQALPVLVVLASLLGYWLSGTALRPVKRLIEAAEHIGAQNLSQRLPLPAANDELRRLTVTLNAMLERIEGAFHRIRQFTADASHDLRTPVAVIRGTAEVTLRRPRQEDEYRDALLRIQETSEQTTELLENLLLLARSDAGAVELEMRPIDLSEYARKVGDHGAALAADKPLSIKVAAPVAPIWIWANGMAIHRLMLILMDNAVKYTPAGGVCEITVSQNDQLAHIEVRDTGIGISEGDIDAVFERFRRADRARSRETPGAGLGLAIARWIAEIHGGSIGAESVLGAGSVFHVHLPVWNEG